MKREARERKERKTKFNFCSIFNCFAYNQFIMQRLGEWLPWLFHFNNVRKHNKTHRFPKAPEIAKMRCFN